VTSSRSLLVIGGSGFFGKSILDAHARGLLEPWDIGSVAVVARRASALRGTHPALIGEGVSLHDADVGTATMLPDADYVVHAASSTDAARYVTHAAEERANILAAIDNYRAVAKRSHPGAGIVYCSSGAVYGRQPPELSHVDEDFTPGDAAGLVAYKRDYAEAKRLAEARMAELGAVDMRVAVARCFAFMGVHLPRDQHFAIGNFLADGLAGRPVTVNARGPVHRSWMHADDLVHWLMSIAAAARTDCPVYNVGSDEPVTVRDVARAVAARFGVSARMPDAEDAPVDRYVPSTRKAALALGLRRRFDFAAALDDVAGRIGGPLVPPPVSANR
jgi:dTDP-glucose 4,6-dehydratase